MLIRTTLVLFTVITLVLTPLHPLTVLITVEILVLGGVFILRRIRQSWLSYLALLLVSVCLGGYGVSLVVSFRRSKGINLFNVL